MFTRKDFALDQGCMKNNSGLKVMFFYWILANVYQYSNNYLSVTLNWNVFKKNSELLCHEQISQNDKKIIPVILVSRVDSQWSQSPTRSGSWWLPLCNPCRQRKVGGQWHRSAFSRLWTELQCQRSGSAWCSELWFQGQ